MKRKPQFAWEDQRFSSKDTMPLASKLILPEDETQAALEISRSAGVFDDANHEAVRRFQAAELWKRARLQTAEREAADEWTVARQRLVADSRDEQEEPVVATAVPTAGEGRYSLGAYDSSSDEEEAEEQSQ